MGKNSLTSNTVSNPPPDDTTQANRSATTLMKAKLRAVGLNELLGSLVSRFIQQAQLFEAQFHNSPRDFIFCFQSMSNIIEATNVLRLLVQIEKTESSVFPTNQLSYGININDKLIPRQKKEPRKIVYL